MSRGASQDRPAARAPRKANRKIRPTTRIGRRTGHDPIDEGTPLLRQRKVRLTGRTDLELNPAGILLGHQLIDAQQYQALTLVTLWLQRTARAWGGKDGSCTGLWQALLSATTATRNPVIPVSHGADSARYQPTPCDRGLDRDRRSARTIRTQKEAPFLVDFLNPVERHALGVGRLLRHRWLRKPKDAVIPPVEKVRPPFSLREIRVLAGREPARRQTFPGDAGGALEPSRDGKLSVGGRRLRVGTEPPCG